MFYFYVMKSKRDNELYWGFTEDLRKRFKEHNSGYAQSTKHRKPFILVYYEAYRSGADAKTRERQIKRRAGAFTSLKRRIQRSIE